MEEGKERSQRLCGAWHCEFVRVSCVVTFSGSYLEVWRIFAVNEASSGATMG